MNVLGIVVNAVVIGVVGTLLGSLGKGRFDGLDRRIDRLEDRLDRRIDGLQGAVTEMRSDLTQVALAVGVKTRASNG
jgi:hypothetical protein